MADLVAVAENARTKYTSLADRMARLYSPSVHILSLAAFTAWMYLTGDLRLAVNIAAAVLIITCPCALGAGGAGGGDRGLGQAFPQGLPDQGRHRAGAAGRGRHGGLRQDRDADDGRAGAAGPVRPVADDLEIVAALAGASAHPLSRALAGGAECRRHSTRPLSATCAKCRDRASKGAGAACRYGSVGPNGSAPHRARGPRPGSPRAMRRRSSLRLPTGPRPGADVAVRALIAAGRRVILLSGDSEAPVAALAQTLGIPVWQSGMRPEEKAARIAALTGDGHRVLMVGDGLNDTAALAGAHVSISPATALDAARSALGHRAFGPGLVALAGCAPHRASGATADQAEFRAVAGLQRHRGSGCACRPRHAADRGAGDVGLVDHRLAQRAPAEVRAAGWIYSSTCIPVSLLLGGIGLVAFLWSLKHRQYDDPEGDANRILSSDWDDRPKP